MALTKEAEQNKPKKPLSTYFKFSQKRYAELG
jgi:hypothetical protein